MEEQLISFKTAKLAKEKGFVDYNCKKYNKNGDKPILGYVYQGISAPTQSLLQKWLRDKCKIQIEITYYRDGDCYFVKLCSYRNSNLYFSKYINTYEEALEEGLQEALKLIKIKNNE